jgi:hypothetical protein
VRTTYPFLFHSATIGTKQFLTNQTIAYAKKFKATLLEGKIDRKNLRYVCGWGAKNFDVQKNVGS